MFKKRFNVLLITVLTISMFFSQSVKLFADNNIEKSDTQDTVQFVYEDGELIEEKDVIDGKVFIPYEWHFDLKDIDGYHFDRWTLKNSDDTISENKEIAVNGGEIFVANYAINRNNLQIDLPRTVEEVRIEQESSGLNKLMYSNTSFPNRRRYQEDELTSGKYKITITGLTPSSSLNTIKTGGQSDVEIISEGFEEDKYIIHLNMKMTKNNFDFLRLEASYKDTVQFVYEDGELIEEKDVIDGKVFIPYEWHFDLKDIDGYHFDRWTLKNSDDTISENKEIAVNGGEIFVANYAINRNNLQIDLPRTVEEVRIEQESSGLNKLMYSNTSFPNRRRYQEDELTSGKYKITITGLTPSSSLNTIKTGGQSDVEIISEGFEDDKYIIHLNMKMTKNNFDFLRLGMTEIKKHMVKFDLGSHGKSESGLEYEIFQNKSVMEVPTVIVEEGYEFLGFSLDGVQVIDPRQVEITEDTTFLALYKAGQGTFVLNDLSKQITDITLISQLDGEKITLSNSGDNLNSWSHQSVKSGNYIVQIEGLHEKSIIDFANHQQVEMLSSGKGAFAHDKVIKIVMNPANKNAESSADILVSYIISFDPGTRGSTEDLTEIKVLHGDAVGNMPKLNVQEGYLFKTWLLEGVAVDPTEFIITKPVEFLADYVKEKQNINGEEYKPSESTGSDSMKPENNKIDKVPQTDVSQGYLIYVLNLVMGLFLLLWVKREKQHK